MTSAPYTKISESTRSKIINITGAKNVITDKAGMEDFTHDEYSLDKFKSYPELVTKPGSAAQVSELLKLANSEKFPVYPRGGGTGLCGGCVPTSGGLVVMFENMNRVLEVDTQNIMAVAEPGVSLAQFYKEVEKHGLHFPPHPGDENATIGGVISTNAGGSGAVKYGVVRNYVKGLEVVLPTGEIIHTGGKIMKNSTGYSLLNLFIGAEGTLGIVTKAIINLLSPAQYSMTLVVPFAELSGAISTVPEIIRAKINPMTVEFIEKDIIPLAEKHLDRKWPQSLGKADLMITVDGDSEDELLKVCARISDICIQNGALEIFVADTKEKQKNILFIRSNLYEVIKKYMLEDLDIVVPRANIAELVAKVRELEKKYGMWMPTYGHAADGNVHVHILKAVTRNGEWVELPEKDWKTNYEKATEDLYSHALKMGGQLSGEHGIGILKKKFIGSFLDAKQLELMKRVKAVFDPNNILNPGKII
ncbi:MAG: hypothetical protein A2297_01865 [Elusimicrobia bacterium RIFOXYB2_FULL_48_7]|nr:MAG: hypothetical protein A2297_01865 [Elusimicrobia bacterium RIFOXYB2_FULL_48_7]